jgi:hypothetical protein
MPWLPTTSRPTPTSPLYDLRPLHQTKVIVLSFLLLLIVIGFFVSMPIVIVYALKTEVETWVPPGIRCDRSNVYPGVTGRTLLWDGQQVL